MITYMHFYSIFNNLVIEEFEANELKKVNDINNKGFYFWPDSDFDFEAPNIGKITILSNKKLEEKEFIRIYKKEVILGL